MEAYRDQYATLFNNGRNVTVIGISVDPDTALASWAGDEDFPVVFASDPGGRVGQLYGAFDAKNKLDNRSLFVIRPDGRVAYVTKPFKVLTPSAYTDVAAGVDSRAPPAKGNSEKKKKTETSESLPDPPLEILLSAESRVHDFARLVENHNVGSRRRVEGNRRFPICIEEGVVRQRMRGEEPSHSLRCLIDRHCDRHEFHLLAEFFLGVEQR